MPSHLLSMIGRVCVRFMSAYLALGTLVGCSSTGTGLPPEFPKEASEAFEAPSCIDDMGSAEEAWKKFRTTFPFHHQTIAASDLKHGCRTLVIAEPPPHTTLTGLKSAVGAPTSDLIKKRQRMGFDGWVADIVLNVAAGDDQAFAEMIGRISQYLFQTSYKAYYTPITGTAFSNKSSVPINVQAQPGELYTWLFKNNAQFGSIYDDNEKTAEELLSDAEPGVYFETTRGLVTWVLPLHSSLDEYAGEARQFAIDSDLIVGALAGSKNMVVVGRERQAPLDALPPLRFETLELLSRVGEDELSQSFERRHVLAGPLERGDWGPIYLSDALIDTEFGSLLNITDQLLKGWSLLGLTRYEGFGAYPIPETWPFKKLLLHELKSSSVVFNWNTAGFGWELPMDSARLLAFGSTGALPLTYLPDGEESTPASLRLAAKGYAFFNEEEDVFLVRAAQYSAIYQAFHKFLDAPKEATAYERDPVESALEEQTFKALNRLASIGDGKPEDLDWARDVGLELNGQGHIQITTVGAEQRAVMAALPLIHDMPLNQRRLLARRLANPRKMVSSDYSMSNEERLALNLFRRTGNLLTQLVNPKKVIDAIVHAANRRPSVWIHTPSIVASENGGALKNARGGHSISTQATQIHLQPQLARGTVNVSRAGVVQISTADLPRLEVSGGNVVRLGQAPKTVERALATPPISVESRGHQANTWTLGWVGGRGVRLPAKESTTRDTVGVERLGDGYEVTTPSGRVFKTRTKADAIDIVKRSALQRTRQRNKAAVRIESKNFTPDEARAFEGTVRTAILQGARAKQAELLNRPIKGDFDVAKMKVETVASKTYPDGRHGVEFKVEIPHRTAARPSFLMRVRCFFRGTFSSETIEDIQNIIKSTLNKFLGRSPSTEELGLRLKQDLKKAGLVNPRSMHLEINLQIPDVGDITITELDMPSVNPSLGLPYARETSRAG